ncbi:15291_t:CDS:2 [Rhizophagus irregularis]|nr:15291_t:CDS:2 [Rhizophagus irregularis]
MASIKVTFGQTSHGDVITLSTDTELQQILSDQESFGTNVKFNIYTSENSDNNDWVLENAEEKDDSVVTISDDEITSKKDDEIIAYNIGDPSETENTENNENNENVENVENTENTENIENTENTETEINQVVDVQTEEQQPAVEMKSYPRVTVTDEKDDPLFESTLPKENSEKQFEDLLTPVDSVNKEQNQENPVTPAETPTESSNNANASPNTPDENNEESDDDPSVIFIFSSRPYIQRTYYRPRVNLFNSLLNGCGLTSRGFGGFGGFGSGFSNGGLYHFGL